MLTAGVTLRLLPVTVPGLVPVSAVMAIVAALATDQLSVVEAPIGRTTVTRIRTVRIQNAGDTAADLTPSYDGLISQPGVSYEVRPSTVRVQWR